MAFEKVEEKDPQEGKRTFFKKDPDSGKPVFVGIRVTPVWWKRGLRHRLAKGLTSTKAAKEDVNKVVDRTEEFHREQAIYAMTFTENFEIRAAGPASAATISAALGRQIEPRTDVPLDGLWTDDVKRMVFEAWPEFAAWVVVESDKQSRLEAEEEEDLGKTSRPS